MEPHYGIRELVQVSGTPRRTIRYYVQRGLIPPPLGAGRGHYYTEEHLAHLRRVRDLQAEGKSLDEIAARLAAEELDRELDRSEGAAAKKPKSHRFEASIEHTEPREELATHIHLTDGVELVVRRGARVASSARLRALAEFARRILEVDD